MKVVVNRCFGGFGLSQKALDILGAANDWQWVGTDECRSDPRLIEVVEQLGAEANSRFASLEVVEIPIFATDWEINEYDGCESVTYVLNGKLYHT